MLLRPRLAIKKRKNYQTNKFAHSFGNSEAHRWTFLVTRTFVSTIPAL